MKADVASIRMRFCILASSDMRPVPIQPLKSDIDPCP
jgi:hypothetical protein